MAVLHPLTSIRQGDRVSLSHTDGHRINNTPVTGTERYVGVPGASAMQSLERLVAAGWSVTSHAPKYPDGMYAVNMDPVNGFSLCPIVEAVGGDLFTRQADGGQPFEPSERDVLTRIVPARDVFEHIETMSVQSGTSDASRVHIARDFFVTDVTA